MFIMKTLVPIGCELLTVERALEGARVGRMKGRRLEDHHHQLGTLF